MRQTTKRKSFWQHFTCASLGLAVAMAAGCTRSTTTASGTNLSGAKLSQHDLGNEWPLTVDAGEIRCVPVAGEKEKAIVFTSGGRDYCINGVALRHKMGPDIRDIWLTDPNSPGGKRPFSPFMERVDDVCPPETSPPSSTADSTSAVTATPPVKAKPAWATMFLQCLALKGKSKDAVVAALGPPIHVLDNRYAYAPQAKEGELAAGLYLFFDPDKKLETFTVLFNGSDADIAHTAGEVWEALDSAGSKPDTYQADPKSMRDFWTDNDREIASGSYVRKVDSSSYVVALNGTIQGKWKIQLNCRIAEPLMKGTPKFDTNTDSYIVGELKPNPAITWRDARVLKILPGRERLDSYDYPLQDNGTAAPWPAKAPAKASALHNNRKSESTRLTQLPGADVTPSQSPQVSAVWHGEHFAQTRTRYLRQSDIANWNYAQTRYALNEIYARHGYAFKSAPIRHQFEKFRWYHPGRGRTQEHAETLMSPIEKANVKLLSRQREYLENVLFRNGE